MITRVITGNNDNDENHDECDSDDSIPTAVDTDFLTIPIPWIPENSLLVGDKCDVTFPGTEVSWCTPNLRPTI